MKKLKTLFKRKEFITLFFFMSALLFTMPLLVMSSANSMQTVYLSLFLPWGAVIVLLFMMSRSFSVGEQKEEASEHEEVRDA
jgi:hypothetical protein